ncbi:MAG: hypothetical protein LH614_21560 [Pyrinomonadaceae bacterium]|nr:hypothetical protein [Pyrinomonadaceae bacterium]
MNTQQNLSSQQILSAVQTMPLDELEKLVGNVLAVRAERIAPHLSGEETKLLRIIQKTLPDKNLKRMKELQTLRDEEKLLSEGFAELAELIEKLEEIHAKRINAVVALADLRGVSFQTAMQQVGLTLPDYE